MNLVLPFIVLAVLCRGVATAEDPYAGDWKNVDIRGVENRPPACTRVWFEERSYALQRPDALQGIYSNVIRAAPVGAPSSRPDCKYPAPASNPIAQQLRMWRVIGRPDGSGGFRVAAEAAPGGGDMNVYKTQEFRTVLTLRSGRLIDETQSGAANGLVFRRAAEPPAAARRVLEETISRLESGGCLDVMAAMGAREKVAQMCELRRRMAEIAGRYIGLSVISSLEFDRVPDRFPNESKALKSQHGVHFSFNGQYENQKLHGDALVFEEEGRWRVAFLWF